MQNESRKVREFRRREQEILDTALQLFLEQGERGQSWRLAMPSGSDDGRSQTWITYPLAIDPA